MNENQEKSISNNDIYLNSLDYGLQSKTNNNGFESIFYAEYKAENIIKYITNEGNETSMTIINKKPFKITISDVKNPKNISKRIEKKKKEKEEKNDVKKLEKKDSKESKDTGNDSFDDSMNKNIFSNIGINNQIRNKKNINNLKEYEIKNTYYTSKITKNDEFTNDIIIPIPKFLFDCSLDILYKKDIIYVNKTLLSYCLSNFIFSMEYRAKSEFGLKLKFICFKNIKRINFDSFEEILKGNIEDLFIKYSNLNSEEKKSFRQEKESLLKIENENKIHKIKLLSILFSKKIEEIFKMYLNDYKYISNGKIEFFFKLFKTFEDDFYKYNSKQKQNIKKCVNLLLGYELANLKITSEEDNNEKYNLPKKKLTKINYYNSRRKIIFTSLKSFFYNSIKEYVKINFETELFQPTLKDKLAHNVEQYFNFFTQNLIFIFTNLVPKRFNPKINYSQQIYDVLKKEKEKEKEENRILDKLLNSVQIFNIIKAFINDDKIINIKESNGNEFELYFINFKTYKDYFKYLSKEIKDNYKKDFINLLENKIKPREKSCKRNLILRKNKNLRKKRKRSD